MKPSLVRSTRLSGSVKLRCTLGSGSFEGGRGTGPERLRFSALRFSSAARSASASAASSAAFIIVDKLERIGPHAHFAPERVVENRDRKDHDPKKQREDASEN